MNLAHKQKTRRTRRKTKAHRTKWKKWATESFM